MLAFISRCLTSLPCGKRKSGRCHASLGEAGASLCRAVLSHVLEALLITARRNFAAACVGPNSLLTQRRSAPLGRWCPVIQGWLTDGDLK